jgi:hypothetical protein
MKNSFNPNEVEVLAKVVDEACQKLGHDDEMTKQNLAARVLHYAAQGERDFNTLLSVALSGRAVADAA